MKRLYIGNLPSDATEESVTTLFSNFGKIYSIKLAYDIFSSQCKGFGFISMEGHEARAAISGLDGKLYCGKPLKVKFEEVKSGRNGRR